jgi:hypothetical protein
MENQHEQPGDTQEGETGATTTYERFEGEPTQTQPSEEDRSEIGQRAAYEAELNRITSTEMILQTTVSLLNIGGRRLGLAGPPDPQSTTSPPAGERDLEQVRDAIDGARALMPILERHMAGELGPLRDAVSQLQMAYAREVHGARQTGSPAAAPASSAEKHAPSKQSPAPSPEKPASAERPAEDSGEREPDGPGPAQASGRLWVPGR